MKTCFEYFVLYIKLMLITDQCCSLKIYSITVSRFLISNIFLETIVSIPGNMSNLEFICALDVSFKVLKPIEEIVSIRV